MSRSNAWQSRHARLIHMRPSFPHCCGSPTPRSGVLRGCILAWRASLTLLPSGDWKVPATRRLESLRHVAQTFLSAGSGDFPVA
jgi:hypothetical protein